MGRLLSARFMTPTQLEQCCTDHLSTKIVGYAVYTSEGRRIGTVDDLLIDDEMMVVRFLVVDTSTAEFILNQPHLLLAPNLCCWDDARKTVQAQATMGQVQSAPDFDRVAALGAAYEETAIFAYGEPPFGPADH